MPPTPDPLLVAARQILDQAVADAHSAIEGASVEDLNWRPTREDTNSIAVLAVHAMGATRMWFSVALAAPLPQRDREQEFAAAATGAADLLRLVNSTHTDCQRLLDDARVDDWAVMRRAHPRPDSSTERQVTAAWALTHALEHLREHVGQMSLTRQLRASS